MSICTSLDLYIEMGPPMSENQVKESQSHVASRHSPRRGMGHYRICNTNVNVIFCYNKICMNTSSYGLKYICIGHFKHHYGGSFTWL